MDSSHEFEEVADFRVILRPDDRLMNFERFPHYDFVVLEGPCRLDRAVGTFDFGGIR